MKIEVNGQTQKFYLALNEWLPVTGHGITVGEYKFCAIPMNDIVNVSEATSGCKVFNIAMTPQIMAATSTKEDTIHFLNKVGASLKGVIEKQSNFDEHVKKMRKVAFESLGEMPPVENVDTDWVFEDESEVLN